MRIVWSGILVVLMLASGVMSSGFVRAQAAPADYLPSSLFLPHADCFRIEGDGVLDFAGLVARFPGVPDAATVLDDLGWYAGAYRQYACDTPPPGQAGWIDISVHLFATEAGAQAAGPFFAEAKLLGTSLQMVPGVTAVTGPAGNGTEYTQYVTYGNILFRVTGVAPSGSPRHDVEQVATMQIAGAGIVNSQQNAAAPPSAAPTASYPYRITDLGTEDGNWSSASAINNQGQVLWAWGEARDSLSLDTRFVIRKPMLSQAGAKIRLWAIGIEFGRAINDSGVVLGTIGLRSSILYSSTTDEFLPGFGPGSAQVPIVAINDVGAVASSSTVFDPSGSYSPVKPSEFQTFQIVAISNSNWAAGTAHDGSMSSNQRAVLAIPGQSIVLDPAPGAAGSNAVDLNDLGQVIGNPQRMGMHSLVQYGHAFLYDHRTGITTDLGVLPGYRNSTPAAINNAEQVVGAVWAPLDEAQPFRVAFLYDHRTGTMVDLNSLIDPARGWHLVDAVDINDAGQIVGAGHINGETHAFLLTPNP